MHINLCFFTVIVLGEDKKDVSRISTVISPYKYEITKHNICSVNPNIYYILLSLNIEHIDGHFLI